MATVTKQRQSYNKWWRGLAISDLGKQRKLQNGKEGFIFQVVDSQAVLQVNKYCLGLSALFRFLPISQTSHVYFSVSQVAFLSY